MEKLMKINLPSYWGKLEKIYFKGKLVAKALLEMSGSGTNQDSLLIYRLKMVLDILRI